MTLIRVFSIVGLAALITACSAAGVLNGITPSSSFDRDKDVAYGEVDRQTMDIYRAAEPRPNAPVIVFLYGGGWTDGRKGMYKFVADGFTREGFDVVVPDYRLYPDSLYPEMITDTGAAVSAVAERFPDKPLVLIGHSAGAYNVLMTAMAPELSGVDVCGSIAGIVSLAGPTGAYPMTEEPYLTIFPDRFKADDAPMGRSPDALPRVMLVNGKDDETVGYRNATVLGAALDKQGLRNHVAIYEDMDHIDPVRVLSRYFDGGSTLKDDVIAFIDQLPESDFCVP